MRHTHRLLVRHILAVRSIPIFSHCKAVLIFESNLAFESQHLLHALEANGIKNWVSLSEGQQGSLGWLTTNGACAPYKPCIKTSQTFLCCQSGRSKCAFFCVKP